MMYPSITADGTIACREFPDEQGRVYKKIYYRQAASAPAARFDGARAIEVGPLTEEDLIPHSIRLLRFGDSGLLISEEQYDPEMKLLRIFDITYSGNNRPRYVERSVSRIGNE